MKIRGSEVATGLFALTVIAVGVVLLMLGGFFTGGAETVDCVAYFDDINLLEPNARVAMNGYEVGRVTSLEPIIAPGADGDVTIRVTFQMKEEVLRKLGADTTAEIAQESFLGAKYVKIIPATTGGEIRQEDGRYLIATSPLFDIFQAFREMKGAFDPLIAKLTITLDTVNDDILTKLSNDLLSEENIENFSAIVAGGSDLVRSSQDMVEKINSRLNREGGTFDAADALVRDLRSAVAEARAALEQLKKSGSATLAQMDATLATADATLVSLHRRLDESILPRVEAMLDDASRLMATSETSISTVASDASRALDGVDGLVRDPNLYGALLEMRELLREMKLLTLSLRSDPSQLLFGGPGDVQEASEPRIDRARGALDGRGAPYGY